ncbi:uncharacterized protein PG986_010155 [Apiospora aurea]|uniref:Uncharacterized protein n=1 Tax=Apiospora aurea TaxID=335848 RepID=A0ABR1Q9S4_9PEZI
MVRLLALAGMATSRSGGGHSTHGHYDSSPDQKAHLQLEDHQPNATTRRQYSDDNSIGSNKLTHSPPTDMPATTLSKRGKRNTFGKADDDGDAADYKADDATRPQGETGGLRHGRAVFTTAAILRRSTAAAIADANGYDDDDDDDDDSIGDGGCSVARVAALGAATAFTFGGRPAATATTGTALLAVASGRLATSPLAHPRAAAQVAPADASGLHGDAAQSGTSATLQRPAAKAAGTSATSVRSARLGPEPDRAADADRQAQDFVRKQLSAVEPEAQ